VPDVVPLVRDGITTVNLGFVTASGGACRPAWGGIRPVDDADVVGLIRRFRAAGGDVRVSFGGADGVELASACPTPEALAAAYAQVVDALGVRLLDLDVEGAALADAAAVARRDDALHRVQADAESRGRPLRVSYTLPADPTGLTPPAQALLRDARQRGVRVDAVDVLAMDYGGGTTDLVGATTGAVAGASSFAASLGGPPIPVAATVMIGVNDVPGEVLRPEDARRVADLARSRRLAWLGFWSLGRDRPCPPSGGATPAGGHRASPTCSGVPQPPGAFLAALSAAGGAAAG
jgi:predicted peroxiredoxin